MSKAQGKKRASPGGGLKNSGLETMDLSDEQVKLLEDAQKERERVELFLSLHNLRHLQPTYKKQRQIFKDLPKFWPTALYHHPVLELATEHAADRDALSYLHDVWVERNTDEPRAFRIEFHFNENSYFSDKVLVKDYKYTTSDVSASTTDEYGLTAAQRDLDEDRDIEAQPSVINWKSDSKNLVAQYPRKMDTGNDAINQETGSFFNWFVEPGDEYSLGSYIVEVFEDAVRFFFNTVETVDDEDITDSDEEEEEEGDEEIDLENPKKKARKL